MATFATEKWPAFSKEAEGLMRRHWEEVALDRDRIPMGMDHGYYQRLEDAGILHVVTMRVDGQLAGYFIALVSTHPHYKDAGIMAFTDIYYLAPEHRRGNAGARMFAAVEASLRERGAVKLYVSHKLHKDHSLLFEALGYKPTDISYTKLLD